MPIAPIRSALLLLLSAMTACSLASKHGEFGAIDQGKMGKTIESYQGTPYLYGGTTKSGIDCSGFTAAVYAEHGMRLPHSSREQWTLGRKVQRNELAYGDLLFFNLDGQDISHVGIYTGNGRFAHAAVSQGVTQSQLDSAPYKAGYVGARRIQHTAWIQDGESRQKIAALSEFPMQSGTALSFPSSDIAQHRQWSLGLLTSATGRDGLAVSASLFDFIEAGGGLSAFGLLTGEKPTQALGLYRAQVNLLNERAWLPESSLGYSRQIVTLRQSQGYRVQQGFFGVFSKHYRKTPQFLLGNGSFISGLLTNGELSLPSWNESIYFSELHQQFFRWFQVNSGCWVDGTRNWSCTGGLQFAPTQHALLEVTFRDIQDLRPGRWWAPRDFQFTLASTF